MRGNPMNRCGLLRVWGLLAICVLGLGTVNAQDGDTAPVWSGLSAETRDEVMRFADEVGVVEDPDGPTRAAWDGVPR